MRVEAFRFDEHLVRGPGGETHDLVLDRRAVARADALDHAGVQRRPVRRRADQLVGAFVGVRDVAADLSRMLATQADIGEHGHRLVAGLHREARVVDRATVDARRSAGLEPPHPERQLAQACREAIRRRIPRPTARRLFEADVDLAAEERPDRQHDGRRRELEPRGGDDTGDTAVFDPQVGDLGLEHREVRLVFDQRADRLAVQRAIRLRPRRPHRRALAGVQRAELDAGPIDRARHRAAERVDFLDQVTLADAADGGVAAHLAERLDALRHEQRATAHPRRSQGGFGAGVTAADHDDVVCFGEAHIQAIVK